MDEMTGAQAQKKYCEEKGYPHFAPASGVCYRCRKQIYGDGVGQIKAERAGKTHVTGCPLCCWSYCD